MIKNLDVYLWGDKVGTLVAYKQGYAEKISFYYEPSFQAKGLNIAPIVAPITRNCSLPVYGLSEKPFAGLPSFIADSLPDKWGDKVFGRWAERNNISLRKISPLDKLAYIGSRGMGAFEFVPSTAKELENPFEVELAKLQDLILFVMNDAASFESSLNHDLLFESLYRVGTSAGGRRPKAILNIDLHTGKCVSGQVFPPTPDFTPMIVKFDEKGDVPYTRIEYAYWLMAKSAKLNMMPSYLLPSGEYIHFMTERFDRIDGEKLHVQTLAAMSPSSDSYEDLFETALDIGVLPAEMSQLYLLMVMNVLCGNVDDHSKNFSFMMGKDGMWHISPAYDFTYSVDNSAPWYVNRHSMTINGKDNDIQQDDLLTVARKFNIKNPTSVIRDAVAASSAFRQYALDAGLSEEWTRQIECEIAQRRDALTEPPKE